MSFLSNFLLNVDLSCAKKYLINLQMVFDSRRMQDLTVE